MISSQLEHARTGVACGSAIVGHEFVRGLLLDRDERGESHAHPAVAVVHVRGREADAV